MYFLYLFFLLVFFPQVEIPRRHVKELFILVESPKKKIYRFCGKTVSIYFDVYNKTLPIYNISIRYITYCSNLLLVVSIVNVAGDFKWVSRRKLLYDVNFIWWVYTNTRNYICSALNTHKTHT